ncbi:helix-turn-helix transcriptional regulator [Clostridium botulinum]|nr:DNA-binding protein [Clostridium botulinum]MBY6778491.1 helix-turn-helix transcriptional regulator [Clostridium botulinum]MBY6850522.1 helix-turn-helix transcriptional regulator [Clostridium botulinum]NFF23570.1 helix-turn-helix transcriptional regulator [Clostridium botulinum]NFI50277.1 helix-turn-helix transcriptional regulator [Clostridium botulinum]
MGVKNKLLEIRLSLGYKKQKDFAEYIQVSQANYNKWENNSSQPGMETILKIAKQLNLKTENIVYLEDEE